MVLCGTIVSLVPVEQKHLDTLRVWRVSPDVDRWQASHPEITRDSQREWFNKIKLETDSLYFVIERDTTPIGFISLTDINSNLAQLNIYLGSPEYYGGGYSHEAYILLLDYAFSELGIKTIYARVKKENVRARAFNRMFGFDETEMWERDMVWIELNEDSYKTHRSKTTNLLTILEKMGEQRKSV